MPDPIFAHARLAPVYDAFDGPRDDLETYLSIAAELGARHVVDIGCGTGSLAVALTRAGHRVTGVDPALASLGVARAKDPAGLVTWVHGDATALPALSADLAVMTGNVSAVFLSDVDWLGTLRAVRSTLRPRGHLVFEARRPQRRVWEDWAREQPDETIDVPGTGPVTRRFELLDVSLPLVSFRYTHHFHTDGAEVVSDSTLRFRDWEEIVADLEGTGYEVLSTRDAPDRPGREFVFVTRATG